LERWSKILGWRNPPRRRNSSSLTLMVTHGYLFQSATPNTSCASFRGKRTLPGV
jgi:hypothetical protein